MSSDNSVEVYGYCRGHKEVDRLVNGLKNSGINETAIKVSGKEGRWNRGVKARQRSTLKSLLIGLPFGAVLGGLIGIITQTWQAGASGFHINWLSFIGLILIMALFWGGVAAIASAGVGKLAPSPGNEPAGSGRFLVTVRCQPEDRLKVQSVFVGQGAILTDKQGLESAR